MQNDAAPEVTPPAVHLHMVEPVDNLMVAQISNPLGSPSIH
jgi:hypothetical protein